MNDDILTGRRFRGPNRRGALAVVGLGGLLGTARIAWAEPSAANQWFAVIGDDGHPVPNARAPVELVDDIEDLTGAIWAGPRPAAITLVEFYDYNCPWCRAAEATRDGLRRERTDLRVGLVNNPILSAASAEAAGIDLALLTMAGAGASYALHRRLFETPGRIDRARALDAAAGLGHDRVKLEAAAASPEIAATLARQMRLAASLGLTATPSYVLGGASVLGFPGPRSLSRMIENVATCGAIAC